MNYDVIGDIHGEYDKLEALLRRLGYVQAQGSWRPSTGHTAVFVGDLIDRGPRQVEAVQLVRRMVDAGHARCILGNHEYNAIAFTVRAQANPNTLVRPHTPKNRRQHESFLSQVREGSSMHKEVIDWFRTLPPALDLGHIRIVHAWWQDEYVARVSDGLRNRPVSDQFIELAGQKDSPLWQAMEGLTKGCELKLPSGHSFKDPDGNERTEIRAQWWRSGQGTYRDYAVVKADQRHCIPALPLDPATLRKPLAGAPVFVGHYWMQGEPRPLTSSVACVDFSAAKGGPLVCYRWQGEAELQSAHFVGSH